MNRFFTVCVALIATLLLPVAAFPQVANTPSPPDDRKAGERMVLKINGIDYAFRWCPPGTFAMGSPQSEAERQRTGQDRSQPRVTLSRGFWMLETEVTQTMWENVMGNNPSHFRGAQLPVEMVSWNDCQEFMQKLNGLGVPPAGFRFSLPTEAQWEYACRAGTTTMFHTGSTLTREQANFGNSAGYNLSAQASGGIGSIGQTVAVGSYPANAWGLRDMHGNVTEWVQDWLWYNRPRGDLTDPGPAGPAAGSRPIHRGGDWRSNVINTHSAERLSSSPERRANIIGFRLALVCEDLPLFVQNVEPILPQLENVAPGTIVLPFGAGIMRSEQEDAAIVEHAPIIRLWSDPSRVSREPLLFFALWRDGTIIWSQTNDGRNLRWASNPEHYRATISEKQVEDFLSAFDKVDFLEYSGKMAPMFSGATGHYFFLETEDVQCRFTMPGVFWAEGGRGGPMSPEQRQMANKWQAVLELLLELIPEKGEPMSLSVERKDDERRFIITPAPLRPAAGENERDNGAPLVQPIFPPRNWGGAPLRR
ncbi:MAG: formylglycine-generating enzyme family protein [Planctomycetaceae bacterium]|nr:formylglycine-generating enzyme family protein [Planctomycetaceae bacterium]